MTRNPFIPTDEQAHAITHEGSAFIAACPGSGKTRVLIERARLLLTEPGQRYGVAFLSFTNAAVSELQARMYREGLLKTPVFPHFIGTFDSFLWAFLIAPFGVPGCPLRPCLIPDKDDFKISPYRGARELPLNCFDRITGEAIEERLKELRFYGSISKHKKTARLVRLRLLERGELDFIDARNIAINRLQDKIASPILARALGARFKELVVDETQDCNPQDIKIINWFRQVGMSVKIVCDPHQAIYGFRGGVGEELFGFRESFPENQRLNMKGNFRSSQNIARAIVAFRSPDSRNIIDEALGGNRNDPTPVHILSYPGRSVPSTVGSKFHELTESLGLNACDCPVVASTRDACEKALGHPSSKSSEHLTCRLATAIADYHLSFELGGKRKALEDIHKVILTIQGFISEKTYHQYIAENKIEPDLWRPLIIQLANSLRYDQTCFQSAVAWLEQARQLIAPLLPSGGKSINQRLKNIEGFEQALTCATPTGHCARTIHSVKGMEFPAICVVISTHKAFGILNYLTAVMPPASSEEARKIYVGASRAERLLVIAVPNSQNNRLRNLLDATGANVEYTKLN